MEQKKFTIIDLSQAKTLGLTRYFTGKPCKFNHVDERMVSTRSCVSCKNNKEKFRASRVFSLEQKKFFAEKAKKNRAKDVEKYRQISLKNYHNHKQKRNQQTAKYIALRRKNDALYGFKHRIKSLINQSFRIKNLTKKSKTMQIIGCTFDDLIAHIERQFSQGMNWENRDQWHVDHIVPLATAKNEQDVIALNHFSNLRPLWAKENLQKGSKLNFLI
jgi:hypothetical protein